MNNKSFSSKCTTSNETKQNNTASKLRRLKIEENILLQGIKKIEQKNNTEIAEPVSDIEHKNMTKNLIDSYINIKTLFDDIKIITNTQELLVDVEMDDIKKKVLELETIMRSFKQHLDTELSTLKCDEAILVEQVEEVHLRNALTKKRAKPSAASLKQAIPSPVRAIMTSPLKCTEVQEFQDFMKNSPNRYGGWNEYHHNIFATLWKKHFGNSPDTHCNDSVTENLTLENFIEESLFKLQGIDKNSLMVHIDWYKQYLCLKSKQQIAIDKWKSNRRSIKKIPENCPTETSVQNESNSRKPKCFNIKKKLDSTKTLPKVISSEDIERVMKPTKQWLSRCYEEEQKIEQICNIENLGKLQPLDGEELAEN